MKNTIYIIVLLLILISCKNDNKYYKDVENCANITYNRDYKSIYVGVDTINVFDSIQKLETILIKAKILENNSKSAYEKFINHKGFKTEILNNTIDEVHENFVFYDFVFINYVTHILYLNCFLTQISSKEEKEKLKPTINLFEKIIFEEDTNPSKETLNTLLLKINFNNRVSRLSYLNLVYIHYTKIYKRNLEKLRLE